MNLQLSRDYQGTKKETAHKDGERKTLPWWYIKLDLGNGGLLGVLFGRQFRIHGIIDKKVCV